MQPDIAENIFLTNLPWMIGLGLLIGFCGIAGWIFTTWLRIKHGYPLESKWGRAIEPRITSETAERLKLLTNENAQLRAELGSVKDRLENVERIVTDPPSALAKEIEALALDKGGHA
jgi:hypothetical protein